MSKTVEWRAWFDSQSRAKQRLIAIIAVERLMELEEVDFQKKEYEINKEYLYWTSCGDDLAGGSS